VPFQILDDDHIQITVAIDIADHVSFESFWVVGLNVVFAKTPLTVVLEEIQRVVRSVVGARQIQIAVFIEVRSGNAVSVCVLVGDEMFRKSDWASRRLVLSDC